MRIKQRLSVTTSPPQAYNIHWILPLDRQQGSLFHKLLPRLHCEKMAGSTPQIGYPLKLSSGGALTLDVIKLENHLTEQLSYNQTEASLLVDEITSLVREDNKSASLPAAKVAPHLVNVILQSVDPGERPRFIQIQAGGVHGLYNIASYNLGTFRQILQSVSSEDERLQLLQMKSSFELTLLYFTVQLITLLQRQYR